MDLLCEQPGLGVATDWALPDGRRWKVGAHHIYYFRDGATIRIVRILSAKQNPVRHLP
jgi:plasmid stabilization system protein ParE